ncbi:NrsF family protein [Pendulispora albinea]|uniref:DUF1109 domain-containing protein n=1 Tax=Pendulispora albinea TaxID=2741071 RepID=A0ABZ2M5E1_9BACT
MISTRPSQKPSSDLRARVLAVARQTPSPSRARVTWATRWLVLAAVVSSLAVFFALGGFQLGNRPVPYVYATTAGWAVLALVGFRIAFVRSRRSMLGPARQSLVALAAGMPVALLLFSLVCCSIWPEVQLLDAPLWGYLACFGSTSIMGTLPLVALAIARRGSDPVHPRATGAALGAAMGVWGGTLIDLHCRCATLPHIAFSHVLPMVVLAIVGAVVAPRVLGF